MWSSGEYASKEFEMTWEDGEGKLHCSGFILNL